MQAYAVYAMQLAEPGLQLFRAAMGQGVGHLPVDETVEPGTYHIANGLTGTVLQVSGHDLTKIVSWKLEKDVEKLEQQWCLQRSGTGYRFKNRKYNDLYLSVASTDTHAFVTASKCPSTWVLLKIGDHYGIKLAEHDKMIDLHFGRRANGTEIHIWPSDGSTKQTWNLVRIKDGASEARQEKNSQPRQDPTESTETPRKAQEPLNKADHVEILEKEVIQLKNDIDRKDKQIAQDEITIRQLRAELESNKLQEKVSRQQTEIASLQAKIDRLEYFMSQMRGSASRSSFEGR